jgi:hypothetical protein
MIKALHATYNIAAEQARTTVDGSLELTPAINNLFPLLHSVSNSIYYTMNLRQRLEVIAIIALTFLAFASYHEGTGGVAWVQYLSLISIFFFIFIFDWAFTNESNFMFDPDADNWRRKVVSLRSLARIIIDLGSLSFFHFSHARSLFFVLLFTGGFASVMPRKPPLFDWRNRLDWFRLKERMN